MSRLLAPADTVAQLFCTNQENIYNESATQKTDIIKGENLVHMHCFGKPGETLWLRFDPGAVPGEYRLLPLQEVHQLRGDTHGL